MLLGVLSASFIPLAMSLGDAGSSPVFFGAFMGLGAASGYAVFLGLSRERFLFRPGVWSLGIRMLPGREALFGVVSNFSFPLLSLAAGHAGVPAVAVLGHTWVVFALVLTAAMFRGSGRFGVSVRVLFRLFMALAGVALVTAGSSGGLASLAGPGGWGTLFGVSVALFAALIGGNGAAFCLSWGLALAGRVSSFSRVSRDLASTVLGYCLFNVLAAVPGLVLGALVYGEVPAGCVLFGSAGGLLLAAGAVFWRWSNLSAPDAGVNVLWCAAPLASLSWLFLLGRSGPSDPVLLLPGAVLVGLANLLCSRPAPVR